MAGRLSKQYRIVVYKGGDLYHDKPAFEAIRTRKREAGRECDAATMAQGGGAHGAVYGGPKLNALVHQVRATLDDNGKLVLVHEEL